MAIRYLWGRAREGGRYLRGAAIGIAVSLIPIIVTLIVADGMIRGIIDRYIELGTGHLQVFNRMDPEDLEEARTVVLNEEGVIGAWPEQRSISVLVGKKDKTGATIRAVDPSFWEDSGSAEYLTIVAGEASLQSDREMLLGVSLASAIGAEPGDTVRLMTIRTSDGRSFPRAMPFVVKGIVSSGYHDLDALWCIISWDGGKRVLSPELSSASLIVKIDDPYKNADSKIWDLYSVLDPGYSVYSWKELLSSEYSSYLTTRQLLLFIMALVVLIAAVNVSSATSMLVIERQRDIAVLKVTGASVKGISDIFLWGSFLTGLIGGIVGIAAGLLIAVNINYLIRSLEKLLTFFSSLFHGSEVKILDPGFYLETIPIIIDWKTIFFILCFTVLCSVAASWFPSRRAGKLKPMELLRKY